MISKEILKVDLIPFGYSLYQSDLDQIIVNSREDLYALKGSHVFITGGTGFFGLWIVEALLWANDLYGLDVQITVLSRSPDGFLRGRGAHLRDKPKLRFICGNVVDFDYPIERCTHIIHAASEADLHNASDWASSHLNSAILGTQRIIDLARKHRIEAILFTSSGAVYSLVDKVVDELCVEGYCGIKDYLSERSVYGQLKRMIESMLVVSSQAGEYRTLIARCFAFVGPYLPLEGNYAVGNFIRSALKDSDIIITGDGTPIRSYLYAGDLVTWLLRILVRGRSCVPYNVGGNRSISIGELALLVAGLSNRELNVVTKRRTVKSSGRSFYLPSTIRSVEELDLAVVTPLDIAILKTLEWHRLRGNHGSKDVDVHGA